MSQQKGMSEGMMISISWCLMGSWEEDFPLFMMGVCFLCCVRLTHVCCFGLTDLNVGVSHPFWRFTSRLFRFLSLRLLLPVMQWSVENKSYTISQSVCLLHTHIDRHERKRKGTLGSPHKKEVSFCCLHPADSFLCLTDCVHGWCVAGVLQLWCSSWWLVRKRNWQERREKSFLLLRWCKHSWGSSWWFNRMVKIRISDHELFSHSDSIVYSCQNNQKIRCNLSKSVVPHSTWMSPQT